MGKRNKEQSKKASKNEKKGRNETSSGFGDKKLQGPDRPAE